MNDMVYIQVVLTWNRQSTREYAALAQGYELELG
jgi:hypothetical protein